jgi:hypothetical protein
MHVEQDGSYSAPIDAVSIEVSEVVVGEGDQVTDQALSAAAAAAAEGKSLLFSNAAPFFGFEDGLEIAYQASLAEGREFGCKVMTGVCSSYFLLRLAQGLAVPTGAVVFDVVWFLLTIGFALVSIAMIWMLFCRTPQQIKDTIQGLTLCVTIVSLIACCSIVADLLLTLTYENMGVAVHGGIGVGFTGLALPMLLKVMLQPPLVHNLLWTLIINAVTAGIIAAHHGIHGNDLAILVSYQAFLAATVGSALWHMERDKRKNFLSQIRVIHLQCEKAVLETARRGEVGGEHNPSIVWNMHVMDASSHSPGSVWQRSKQSTTAQSESWATPYPPSAISNATLCPGSQGMGTMQR